MKREEYMCELKKLHQRTKERNEGRNASVGSKQKKKDRKKSA